MIKDLMSKLPELKILKKMLVAAAMKASKGGDKTTVIEKDNGKENPEMELEDNEDYQEEESNTPENKFVGKVIEVKGKMPKEESMDEEHMSGEHMQEEQDEDENGNSMSPNKKMKYKYSNGYN